MFNDGFLDCASAPAIASASAPAPAPAPVQIPTLDSIPNNGDKVLRVVHHIHLEERTLSDLKPDYELSENIINAFGAIINHVPKTKCLVLKSFSLPQFEYIETNNMKRAFEQNLLSTITASQLTTEFETLMIPFNCKREWTLAVICFSKHRLEYYDHRGNDAPDIVKEAMNTVIDVISTWPTAYYDPIKRLLTIPAEWVNVVDLDIAEHNSGVFICADMICLSNGRAANKANLPAALIPQLRLNLYQILMSEDHNLSSLLVQSPLQSKPPAPTSGSVPVGLSPGTNTSVSDTWRSPMFTVFVFDIIVSRSCRDSAVCRCVCPFNRRRARRRRAGRQPGC